MAPSLILHGDLGLFRLAKIFNSFHGLHDGSILSCIDEILPHFFNGSTAAKMRGSYIFYHSVQKFARMRQTCCARPSNGKSIIHAMSNREIYLILQKQRYMCFILVWAALFITIPMIS